MLIKLQYLIFLSGIALFSSIPSLAQSNCETLPDGRSFGPLDTIEFALTNYGRVIGETEGSAVNARSLPTINGEVRATFRVGQENLSIFGKGFDEKCRIWYQIYDPETQDTWFVLSEFIQITGNENADYF